MKMSFQFDDFCRKLSIAEQAKIFFSLYWNELQQKLPMEGIPEYLTWEFYQARMQYFGNHSELLRRIGEVATQTAQFPEAVFLARAVVYLDFERGGLNGSSGRVIAQDIAPFAENTAVFLFMAKAGLISVLRKSYAAHGIPLEMAESYMATLIGISDAYQLSHNGKPGASLEIPSWDQQYATLRMFRIGRLAYRVSDYPWYLPAIYRHVGTGQLSVFCRDGWLLEADGSMPYTYASSAHCLRMSLVEGNGLITGCPIDPWGNCHPQKRISISASEWQPVCSPWSMVADIHIPGGSGMTPELIAVSFRLAKDFLPAYFHRPLAFFSCHSWILNPAWEREIPDSNMAKFQMECYRCPGDCFDIEGLGNVFGADTGNRLELPQRNSLEKAFHRILAAGEKLRSGVIFFLPEHLDQYGTQYYRRQKAEHGQ